MSGRAGRELVEVYVLEPGEGRPPFTFEGALEYLPPDAPLPAVGDVLLLPRNVTGDSEELTYAWGGTLAPFVVVEREHVYFRANGEKLDPLALKPARHMRTLVGVRRLSQEEFYAGPLTTAG